MEETIEPKVIDVTPKKIDKRLGRKPPQGFERKMQIDRETEAEIFKKLAHSTLQKVALEYGFDKYYDTPATQKAAVSNIAQKIKKAPSLYGLTQEVVDLVSETMQSRSIMNTSKAELIAQAESFKDKLDNMRDTVAEILQKKLDKDKKKGNYDSVSYRDLKDLLATIIDKSRLLRGESTEHVLHLSKVDTDKLTPQQSLAIIMKAREAMLEAKN
jgi:hypothetical protein